jgi:hypothetical protein
MWKIFNETPIHVGKYTLDINANLCVICLSYYGTLNLKYLFIRCRYIQPAGHKMTSKYTIIRRSFAPKLGQFDIGFFNRNRNVPLVGCNDYTEKIQVGDVIGIKLKDSLRRKVQFMPCGDVPDGSTIDIFFGSYEQIEEHLFIITKKIKESLFEVKPYYIDGDKIIVKEIHEKLNTKGNIYIPVKNLTKHELCHKYYCYIKNSDPYNFYLDIDKMTEFIKSIENNNVCQPCNLPYKDFRKIIINIIDDKDHDNVKNFFEFIDKNKLKIIELFGCDAFDNLGTYEKIINNIDNYYNKICALIGDTLILNYYFTYNKESHLTQPTIIHKINKIKYVDIFRVYKTDNISKMIKTSHVTNWHGIILDDNVRAHIKQGNLVRMYLFYDKDCTRSVIYCTILMKLTENRFLATIKNMYLSEYEDVVFVIDVRAITEIPVSWSRNDNLKHFERTSGQGFVFTGMGAVGTAEKANELYPITYENIII